MCDLDEDMIERNEGWTMFFYGMATALVVVGVYGVLFF